MKTVDKAMTVLDQFTAEAGELGLSELARRAQLDKAATRRLLVALLGHGFVEQAPETRKYRLGPGFLRLARVREATMPIERVANDVVTWLSGETDETALVTLPGQRGMIPLAYCLPKRAHVVNIVPSQELLFHATASGLIYLCNASEQTRNSILAVPREAVTNWTVTSTEGILALLATGRDQGYITTSDLFERGVSNIAMSFGKNGGDPRGSISLAVIARDFTEQNVHDLLPKLQEAVARMEAAI